MLVDAVTGESRRRIAAADEDELPAVRDLIDRLRHDLVEGGVGRYVLVVVEDDGEGPFQTAVELSEEVPREHGQARTVLGSQERQRTAAAGRGQGQIVEERRHVGVALVQLIPEPAEPPRRQIAGHEGRLAGAWRRPDPGDRPSPGLIELAEEPGPRHRTRQRGDGRLCQRHDDSPIL